MRGKKMERIHTRNNSVNDDDDDDDDSDDGNGTDDQTERYFRVHIFPTNMFFLWHWFIKFEAPVGSDLRISTSFFFGMEMAL